MSDTEAVLLTIAVVVVLSIILYAAELVYRALFS